MRLMGKMQLLGLAPQACQEVASDTILYPQNVQIGSVEYTIAEVEEKSDNAQAVLLQQILIAQPSKRL